MGLIYTVRLANNAAGTDTPYDLPLDCFIKDFEKQKKQAVRKIPGKSGGINTADGKLEPATLELTFMIDDDSVTDLKTLRQTLWTNFNTYEGKYVVIWDLADAAAAADVWLYDELILFGDSRVRRMHMRATRIRVTLALNSQPYEEGGDIP